MRRFPAYLAAAMLFAVSSSARAQSASRTTPGQLVDESIDTIEVHWRGSGELGFQSFHLLVTRRDTGFVGTLRFRSVHDDGARIAGYNATVLRCDTTMAAYIPLAAAKRILTLVDSTTIEVGPAPRVHPSSTDFDIDRWFRLAGQRGALRVTDMSAVRYQEVDYHVPPSDAWKKLSAFQRSFMVDHTALADAATALEGYLRFDDRELIDNKCRKAN